MEKFIPSKDNNEKVVISIRLDNNLLETVDEEANNAGISRNEFISQCIEYALKNIEKKVVN